MNKRIASRIGAFPSIATYVAPILQPVNAATVNAYLK